MESLTFRSVKGREIKNFIFGNIEPTVLVIGGIHGDEGPGAQLAKEFVRYLSTLPLQAIHGRIVVIPVANPDGFFAGTRVNARGIDINRNFPTKDFRQGRFKKSCYPGRQPASEPETVAILQIASQFEPQLILTFHSEMGCVNFDGPAAEVAKAISSANGLPVRQDLGYRTPGSLGTYFGVERNIPVITLELLGQDNQWERHGKAILESVLFIQEHVTADCNEAYM